VKPQEASAVLLIYKSLLKALLMIYASESFPEELYANYLLLKLNTTVSTFGQ
jgi:hypothetical protein